MSKTRPGHVTELLQAWTDGDSAAEGELMPLIYEELSLMANRLLRPERSNHTLEPAALVHEAYLRLVDQRSVHWRNRQQFFAIAARVMRRVLIDYARGRGRAKRGGGWVQLQLLDNDLSTENRRGDIEEVDQALKELAALDPRKASIVELRFFGGMTAAESAAALDCSEATVGRDWRLAKAWLVRALSS